MPAAITSIGVVTALGAGCDALLSGVLSAVSAIGPVARFSTEGLCSHLGAEVPSAALGSSAAGDRASRLLAAAAEEALAARSRTPSPRRGVCVGTTKGSFELFPGAREVLGLPARWLAQRCGARGPVLTSGAACASSMVALGEALALLRSGLCDEVLVGGVEALEPFVYRGFHALKAMSKAPAAPFDRDRSGLTLGEGAVVVVLEDEDRARAAGRSPLARVEGFGTSADAHDQAAPDPSGEGLALAARRALRDAGRSADAIERYHAHGTATVHNDRMEAAAHRRIFGGRPVPVCAVKGSVGHTLGAAALLDVSVCALSMRRGLRPPIVGLRAPDPASPVPAVWDVAERCSDTLALVASAGFGGINAAVVVQRLEA